jgi:DNA-binding MarR family transcriptional regulator
MEGFSMSTETTADRFMELIQRYMRLRPKLILPEHVRQFRKKMEALRRSGYHSEDHTFIFRILSLLSRSQEPLSMGQLSAELEVPMSTATRIVDGLVRGGMAERVNDPGDRRVVRVGMSRNGRELYEAGMSYNKQRIARLLTDFTEQEQAELLRLMNKLFDAMMNEQ